MDTDILLEFKEIEISKLIKLLSYDSGVCREVFPDFTKDVTDLTTLWLKLSQMLTRSYCSLLMLVIEHQQSSFVSLQPQPQSLLIPLHAVLSVSSL